MRRTTTCSRDATRNLSPTRHQRQSDAFHARACRAGTRGATRATWLTTLLISIAVCSPVAAQQVTATSRSAGMGEAMTAGVAGTAAMWHNPAGVVSALMYSAEAGYAWDGQSNTNAVMANLVDTKSNPQLGAGLSFLYESTKNDDGSSTEGYHGGGALAFPLMDGLVRLGAGLRYSNIALDGTEVLAALSLDAGLIVQPFNALTIGVAGRNLVNGGYDEELRRSLAVGVALASLALGVQVSGDVAFDFSHPTPEQARSWRAGAEYFMGELFPVRMGYMVDELAAESTLTVGAGFRDREAAIGLDVSYQHNLDRSEDRTFIGSLSAYF